MNGWGETPPDRDGRAPCLECPITAGSRVDQLRRAPAIVRTEEMGGTGDVERNRIAVCPGLRSRPVPGTGRSSSAFVSPRGARHASGCRWAGARNRARRLTVVSPSARRGGPIRSGRSRLITLNSAAGGRGGACRPVVAGVWSHAFWRSTDQCVRTRLSLAGFDVVQKVQREEGALRAAAPDRSETLRVPVMPSAPSPTQPGRHAPIDHLGQHLWPHVAEDMRRVLDPTVRVDPFDQVLHRQLWRRRILAPSRFRTAGMAPRFAASMR